MRKGIDKKKTNDSVDLVLPIFFFEGKIVGKVLNAKKKKNNFIIFPFLLKYTGVKFKNKIAGKNTQKKMCGSIVRIKKLNKQYACRKNTRYSIVFRL